MTDPQPAAPASAAPAPAGQPAQTPAPPPPGTPPAPPAGSQRKKLLRILGIVVLLVVVLVAVMVIPTLGKETTDDAFIDGRVANLSAQISGQITRIAVDDNRHVDAGTVLVELGSETMKAKLDQAEAVLDAKIAAAKSAHLSSDLMVITAPATAQEASAGVTVAQSAVTSAEAARKSADGGLKQAQAQLAVAHARVDQAKSETAVAEAAAATAHDDARRIADLAPKGAVTQSELDHAKNTADSADAHVQAAKQAQAVAEASATDAEVGVANAGDAIASAEAAVASAKSALIQAQARATGADTAATKVIQAETEAALADAEVAQAKAAVAQAQIDMNNTVIRAPVGGWVTHHTVEVGAYVSPGQTVIGLVGDDLWVTANFKETQLTRMRPGQAVTIDVDAYPGVVFTGKVDSIQSGSGARFALLPPENATGNYVKVLQRIPVKIVFDPAPDAEHHLVPGMSVEPTVKLEGGSNAELKAQP
jgi:membrane fusion protein (multidrug efflux system)